MKKQLYATIFLILFIISFTAMFTSYGIKNGKLSYKIYSVDKEYNIEVWRTSKLYRSVLFASREPSFIKLYKKGNFLGRSGIVSLPEAPEFLIWPTNENPFFEATTPSGDTVKIPINSKKQPDASQQKT